MLIASLRIRISLRRQKRGTLQNSCEFAWNAVKLDRESVDVLFSGVGTMWGSGCKDHWETSALV